MIATTLDTNSKLKSLLTQWDEKQSRRKHHNPYALGIYFQQADRVILDVGLGADTRAAIVAGFHGPMLDFILRGFGMAISTRDEQRGSGIYQPISRNHPDA